MKEYESEKQFYFKIALMSFLVSVWFMSPLRFYCKIIQFHNLEEQKYQMRPDAKKGIINDNFNLINYGSYKGVIKREAVYKSNNKDYCPRRSRAKVKCIAHERSECR